MKSHPSHLLVRILEWGDEAVLIHLGRCREGVLRLSWDSYGLLSPAAAPRALAWTTGKSTEGRLTQPQKTGEPECLELKICFGTMSTKLFWPALDEVPLALS